MFTKKELRLKAMDILKSIGIPLLPQAVDDMMNGLIAKIQKHNAGSVIAENTSNLTYGNMKHETTKQRLQELAAINNPFLMREEPLDFKQSPEVDQAKQQVLNAIKDLPYNFKDDDDMSLAGMFDDLIIEALYGGDYDAFEENDGHGLRDKMIGNITQAMRVAVDKEIKALGR